MQHLISGAKQLQISLSAESLQKLALYQRRLLEANEVTNLTAITDDEGVQIRHFLDSLSCLKALEAQERFSGKRMIDVGTGAGFPGIVLKIVCPGLNLTLLEATEKKVHFLESIVELLELENVNVIHGRAEDLGQDPQHRERYDWAVARAVAELPILVEYLLPLVCVGGRALAQKGEHAAAEVQRAEWAITHLGGQVRRLVQIDLLGLAETRYLVILDKIAVTPTKYPRRAGMPTKRPLLGEH